MKTCNFQGFFFSSVIPQNERYKIDDQNSSWSREGTTVGPEQTQVTRADPAEVLRDPLGPAFEMRFASSEQAVPCKASLEAVNHTLRLSQCFNMVSA